MFGQDKAEQFAQEMKAAYRSGSFVQFAALFPPSYVEDVAGVLHAFAGQMDEDLWNKVRESIGKGCKMLAAQHEFLLEIVTWDENIKTEEERAVATRMLVQAILGVERLARHDITSLKSLKKVKANSLLQRVDKSFADARKAYQQTVKMNLLEQGFLDLEEATANENGTVTLTFKERRAPKNSGK